MDVSFSPVAERRTNERLRWGDDPAANYHGRGRWDGCENEQQGHLSRESPRAHVRKDRHLMGGPVWGIFPFPIAICGVAVGQVAGYALFRRSPFVEFTFALGNRHIAGLNLLPLDVGSGLRDTCFLYLFLVIFVLFYYCVTVPNVDLCLACSIDVSWPMTPFIMDISKSPTATMTVCD